MSVRASVHERAASARDRERRTSDLPPLERVVELHGPAVLRFCIVQAGPDRGEDVFQETMLSALRRYEEIRGAASLRPWLFAIAARKAIDAHRDQVRSPQPLGDAEARATAGDATLGDTAIWREVRRLPAKQREAFALRFLGDLSHREIAHVMETTEAAARRNVFEGLERLRTRSDRF